MSSSKRFLVITPKKTNLNEISFKILYNLQCMEKKMALIEAKIKMDLDDIAYIIKHLSKSEVEMLELKLSGQEKILKKRLDDIEKCKVKTLSQEEVFKNV